MQSFYGHKKTLLLFQGHNICFKHNKGWGYLDGSVG